MAGGRAEPQPEPSVQAFHRDAPIAWRCWWGGTASDRSQQKSKTTFPEHTQPTGPLSISIQSRRLWCVSNTAC